MQKFSALFIRRYLLAGCNKDTHMVSVGPNLCISDDLTVYQHSCNLKYQTVTAIKFFYAVVFGVSVSEKFSYRDFLKSD
jgi:hypothetical protein